MNTRIASRSASILPLVIGAVLLAAGAPYAGADTIKLDSILRLDNHGDGALEVTFRLSAMNWDTWKTVYGDHPDLVRRNLIRQYASYELDKASYQLEKDDVNRTAAARIKGKAMAILQKDGSLAVALPKPMRLVTHSGHEWIFTLNTPISELTTHVILPVGETDAQIQNPDTADQKLVFRGAKARPARPGLLIASIVAGGAGILLLGTSLRLPANKKNTGIADASRSRVLELPRGSESQPQAKPPAASHPDRTVSPGPEP